MKTSNAVTAILLAQAAMCSPPLLAQQPPDVVQSDSWENTAMGTNALLQLTPNSCQYCGIENTAAGFVLMSSAVSSERTHCSVGPRLAQMDATVVPQDPPPRTTTLGSR